MQPEEYKKVRDMTGISSQEKFATFLGCSFATVNRLENGNVGFSAMTRMLYLAIKFICKKKLFKEFKLFLDKHK